MTSILDQYEKASQQAGTTAFLNELLDRDRPMFQKQKAAFTPRFPIRHLSAGSGKLVMVLVNGLMLRVDTRRPEKIDELDLTKWLPAGFKVQRLFADPTGDHALVAAAPPPVHGDPSDHRDDANAELLYVHTSSNKPRQVTKTKGKLVTAVGWSVGHSGSSTGPILLGTSRGLVYETELQLNGSDSYWKQVFDLGRGVPVAVTGVEYFRMRPAGEGHALFGVLVTTPTKLYQFHSVIKYSSGRMVHDYPLLQPLFHTYLNAKEKFIEIPSDVAVSRLRVFYAGDDLERPVHVAWMTGSGVLLAQVSDKENADAVLAPQHRMVPYPADADDDGDGDAAGRRGVQRWPLDVALTHFHLAMVFADRLHVICTVNQQLVYEDHYDQSFGELRGLTCDGRAPSAGGSGGSGGGGGGPVLWSFADYAVLRHAVSDEGRHIWRVHLDQNQFDLALNHCRQPYQKSQVLLGQAHHCFGRHQYERAAQLYAQTDASFEEVALKFMRVRQEDALQTFLLQKASGLKGDERMQLSMLVLWLLELMLRKLGALKDAGAAPDSAEYRHAWNALERFTQQERTMECVRSNAGAVYALLSSHGLQDVALLVAGRLGHHQRVLDQHLLDSNYKDALAVLRQQADPELVYGALPALLQHRPKELVDVLVKRAPQLQLERLTPLLFAALCDGDARLANEVIRLVEHLVYGMECRQRSLHTLLFSLYVRYQPQKTLPYLNAHGEDLRAVPYDAQSALRLCLAADTPQLQACVLLYRIMGLYQPAVDMALRVDPALARQTADMPEDDQELRKKLWLRIARHVVEEEKDIQRAMSVLQQCELLKIEDVLPFFPDFTTIDLFKDAISQSLQEYGAHLVALKREMEEATGAADALRRDIADLRHKAIVVQAGDTCDICQGQLLTSGAVYLFPCGHRFHSDCLLPLLLSTMSSARRQRVHDLQRELASLPGSGDTDSLGSSSLSQREKLQQDLDDILAADCVLCGEAAIRSIDAPLGNAGEDPLADLSWD